MSDLQEAIKRATALFADPSKSLARARAALDKLASLPQVDASRLASIGYCMGGTLSLELARDGAPLRGIVSFHGGLQTQRPAAAADSQPVERGTLASADQLEHTMHSSASLPSSAAALSSSV